MARKKRLMKKNRKSWYQRFTSWTLRLLVVVAILVVIAVGMLSLLAGTGDMQRRGLQQAITQMTGMKAEIGELVALKIIPRIEVEVRDVTFKHILGTEETAEKNDENQTQQAQSRLVTGPVQARIGRARIELSAWHLLTGHGVFNALTIENFRSEAGLLGSGVLDIDRGQIKTADERKNSDKPGWVFDGHYSDQPLSGSIGLSTNAQQGENSESASYYLGTTFPLAFALGDYKLSSTLEGNESGTMLRDIVLKHKEDIFAKGTIRSRPITRGEGYTFGIDFGQSRANAELQYLQNKDKQSRLTGTITLAELYMEDLEPRPASLTGFTDFITKTLASTPEDDRSKAIELGDMPLELDVTIARLIKDKHTIGHIKMPIHRRNNILRISPISGALTGGRITGDFLLEAKPKPAELALRAHIADSNYTALQKIAGNTASIKGHANLDLNITAKGKTWPALYRNINGHVSLLAGRGQLAGSALNIWGGGLMSAMVPDFNAQSKNVLNCAVAHFELENSLATAAPLFLDTQKVTIKGAGTINLRRTKALNLVFTPKAKQAAPFDIATAVNVTGPIANPSIMPNMASSASKVGGLLLGAVNPAFLAFSMTDFGLTDQDPCKPFLIGDGSGKARQTLPMLDKDTNGKLNKQESQETTAEPDKQTGQTPN